jgi:hypothetical protein
MKQKKTSGEINGDGFRAEEFFSGFLGDPQLGLKSFKNMYFGVELEVNINPVIVGHNKDDNLRRGIALQVHEVLKDFCIFTTDGSIPFGWEIKTAPSTYEYHLQAWDKFFDFTEANPNLLELHGKSCGIHIHLSRDGFKNEHHRGRMFYFIHRNGAGNRELMEKIAERPYNYRGIKNPSDHSTRHAHRTAIHMGVPHCPTVEVRVFRSTIVRAEFFKNLEFLHSLIRFTRPRCKENHPLMLTSERYLEYIGAHKEEYPNLWNFLNPEHAIEPVSKFLSDIKRRKRRVQRELAEIVA